MGTHLKVTVVKDNLIRVTVDPDLPNFETVSKIRYQRIIEWCTREFGFPDYSLTGLDAWHYFLSARTFIVSNRKMAFRIVLRWQGTDD